MLDAATGKRGARSFDGRHPAVQAAMPLWVQALLPVVFTHCGALDKSVLQQMFLDLPRGVPAAQVARRLREQGQHRRSVQQLTYLATAADSRRSSTQLALGHSTPSTPPQPLADHPAGAYYGSSKWLLSVWLQHLQQSGQLAYAQRSLAAVRGRYLRLDHTFAICNHVRRADGSKPFEAVLTVMNEHCEVLTSVAVPTTSMTAAAPALRAVAERHPPGDGVRSFHHMSGTCLPGFGTCLAHIWHISATCLPLICDQLQTQSDDIANVHRLH